jgi:DHA3 family macrolide efflux protein-like MFS transporter
LTLTAQGLALGAIAVPDRPTLLAGMLGIGVSAGLASVWLSGVFQRSIRSDYLGRVFSVSRLGDLTVTPFMLPLFAASAGAYGIVAAVSVCAAAMTALCLFFATRPEIRTHA